MSYFWDFLHIWSYIWALSGFMSEHHLYVFTARGAGTRAVNAYARAKAVSTKVSNAADLLDVEMVSAEVTSASSNSTLFIFFPLPSPEV